MVKRGFKPLKEVEEGGEERRSITNIVIRRLMSRLKSSINRFRLGLCPRPRWGSLRCSSRSPSRLGKGYTPQHLRHLASQCIQRFGHAANGLHHYTDNYFREVLFSSLRLGLMLGQSSGNTIRMVSC